MIADSWDVANTNLFDSNLNIECSSNIFPTTTTTTTTETTFSTYKKYSSEDNSEVRYGFGAKTRLTPFQYVSPILHEMKTLIFIIKLLIPITSLNQHIIFNNVQVMAELCKMSSAASAILKIIISLGIYLCYFPNYFF